MERDVLEAACGILEDVSQTRSRLQKEEILKSAKLNPEVEDCLKEVLSVALDWYRHYGIAKLPEVDRKGTLDFEESIFRLENGVRISPENVAAGLNNYDPIATKWLRRSLLKNLRAGIGWKTVNKVWPGWIKIFECQLAATLNSAEEIGRWPKTIEPKIDGVRALAFYNGRSVNILSRSGEQLYNWEDVAQDLLYDCVRRKITRPLVFDGEFFVKDLRSTLSVVRSSVNQPDPELKRLLKLYVFDVLEQEEWDLQQCYTPQWERSKKLIFPALPDVPEDHGSRIFTVTGQGVNHPKDLELMYEYYLDRGFEGVMVKEPDSLYIFQRSTAWLKYKPFDIDTFKVVSYYQGTPDSRNANRLGGLFVTSSKGVRSKVGGGFSDQRRDDYWKSRECLIGKNIRVKYKEETDGSLREPVFLGFVD